VSEGACPDSLPFRYFDFRFAFESIKELGSTSKEAQESFNTLKEKLLEFPILRRLNFNKVFILHTDLSVLGIGAIFGQLDEQGTEYVIAYAS
jgi:hypothetical protein